MSAAPKVLGCCTICDAEVFEIELRNPDTRVPTKVGKPHADAMRTDFRMMDGTLMSLTFCAKCAADLEPAKFPAIWARVKASWLAEKKGVVMDFHREQEANGLLAVERTVAWNSLA